MLHVDIPGAAMLTALGSERADICVSIYLRTNPAARETAGERIEFKNLVKEAIARLETNGAVTFANEADALSYGIVDEIAYRVMRAGGRALGVRREDMPGAKPLAAILRYAA